ncbi:MAG: ATP-binding protein [Planctomycetota bacterium]|jgi:CO dehydrogenase maturation factor
MKIAISGKGGAGKTTLSALVCRALEAAGRDVIAVDADSNSNLAYALAVPDPEKITPLADMEDLIREKTGAEKGQYGVYFKMNPEVSDIPERFQLESGRVRLLVMGSVREGGTGCVCPEYVLVKNLIAHLLLNKSEDMVVDMEAGLEHLGRGVTEKVDALLVVVRPSRVSCVTARRVRKLAGDIGVKRVFAVGNGVRTGADEDYVAREAGDLDFLGFIPYSAQLAEYEREGRGAFELPELRERASALVERITEAGND